MIEHPITRRQVLSALPALALAGKLTAQSGKAHIRVLSLSHMTLTVSDRKRSVEFYQGLFGLPVQHHQDVSTGLRIGPGLQYISLAQGGPNAKPAIAHFCMTVEHFTVNGITQALADHGVTKGSPGPLMTWVRTRGPNAAAQKKARRNCMWAIPMASTFSSRMSAIVAEAVCWAIYASQLNRRPPRD